MSFTWSIIPKTGFLATWLLCHGVQRRMISVDNCFHIFAIIIFCFVVALCDLVHDVKTLFHIS